MRFVVDSLLQDSYLKLFGYSVYMVNLLRMLGICSDASEPSDGAQVYLDSTTPTDVSIWDGFYQFADLIRPETNRYFSDSEDTDLADSVFGYIDTVKENGVENIGPLEIDNIPTIAINVGYIAQLCLFYISKSDEVQKYIEDDFFSRVIDSYGYLRELVANKKREVSSYELELRFAGTEGGMEAALELMNKVYLAVASDKSESFPDRGEESYLLPAGLSSE